MTIKDFNEAQNDIVFNDEDKQGYEEEELGQKQ